MYKRILPILCAFALLVVVPAHAAETIDVEEMPVGPPISTQRSWETLALNGRPIGVSRWEYNYGDWEPFEDDRVHWVWHDLDASGAIVGTFEYIIVDEIIYERRNTEQR